MLCSYNPSVASTVDKVHPCCLHPHDTKSSAPEWVYVDQSRKTQSQIVCVHWLSQSILCIVVATATAIVSYIYLRSKGARSQKMSLRHLPRRLRLAVLAIHLQQSGNYVYGLDHDGVLLFCWCLHLSGDCSLWHQGRVWIASICGCGCCVICGGHHILSSEVWTSRCLSA